MSRDDAPPETSSADPREVVRRMQSEYWESVTVVPDLDRPAPTRLAVSIHLDDRHLFLPLESCQHVLRVPRIVRAPLPAPHVRGALAYRGEIFPVLDLRDLLDLPPREPDRKSRVVLLHHAGLTGAVVADRVDAVQEIERELPPEEEDDLVTRLPEGTPGELLRVDRLLRRVLGDIERGRA